jgi:DNA-binding NtrC family response regulator
VDRPLAVRIVDDNRDIAEMVSALLSIEGIPNAITSEDFDLLLHVDRWSGIRVALVDLHLGEPTTGEDILGFLKENCPNIRRVVFSATGDVGSEQEQMRLRELAHAVLVKPAEIGDILAEVRRGG